MIKRYKTPVILLLVSLALALSADYITVSARGDGKSITILFTHDLHDHLLPVKDLQGGTVINSGGFARLQSAILEEKRISPDALILDAGDFSMGTPFQTVFQSDASELRIMGAMGYDAVTFGNHEYDYRATGLAECLTAAIKSSDRLPVIVQSNVVFPKGENGELTPSLAALNKAYEEIGVKDYTVIERNGIRIGIFGLMGEDAAYKAPMSEVSFEDPVESARRVVDVLKNEEGADLIICLSHTGTWEDGKEFGDDDLAQKVPGIDIIISGHSHTIHHEPLVVGETFIGSAGDSCRYLGVMEVSKDAGSGWVLKDYRLRRIDDKLADDAHIREIINGYKELVQQKYFDKFNLEFDQVLAVSSFNFKPRSEISDAHGEDTLGNLISDAYVYAVKQAEGEGYIPVDAAIVPVGTIRGSFYKGEITAADAFGVSSLGIGADGIPGYPLISVYLTGKELKTACEVDASVSPLMKDAQLFISGMNYTFNPNRLIFNKVTDAYLTRPDGFREEIEDEKLYRVVAGLYSAQMLSIVGDKSYGLLSIVPKTPEGVPIADFEEHIITDTAGGELKEWLAIARYLQSFDRISGAPQIPEYYGTTHGRKVVDDSRSVFAVISSPNGIALAVYAAVLLAVTLIVLMVLFIASRRKRLKSNRVAQH